MCLSSVPEEQEPSSYRAAIIGVAPTMHLACIAAVDAATVTLRVRLSCSERRALRACFLVVLSQHLVYYI